MSSPVTVQANKVWQLLTSASTINSYKQTIEVTWAILRETAQLLWLVLCLGLVAGDWFWKKSIAAGRDTRNWVDNLGSASTPSRPADPAETATQMWQNFLTSSKSTAQSLLSKARQQLDLPVEPETPPAPKNVTTVTPPTPVTPPAEPTQPPTDSASTSDS